MDVFYLIPSETYREFLLKNHIELTVSQKAKIISFYASSHEERLEAFEELLSSQEMSPAQREQLETLISREKDFMRKELRFQDLICCREDVMELLIRQGIPFEGAVGYADSDILQRERAAVEREKTDTTVRNS